jgi:hypothetical protein
MIREGDCEFFTAFALYGRSRAGRSWNCRTAAEELHSETGPRDQPHASLLGRDLVGGREHPQS